MGRQASTQGDVYSYGVLLLEIITGKRPTDASFSASGSTIHDWVKSLYPHPHKLRPIVEVAVDRYQAPLQAHWKVWEDVIMEMIELGLICTQYNPSTRPSMLDVAHEMGKLKHYINNCSVHADEEDCSIKVG